MESSRRRKLAAVKSFYQYLFLTEQIKDNPSHSVKVRSKRQRLPKVLAPAEVELLLRAAVGRDFMIRDRALLEFFYATGARAAEVEALNLDSFDWEACEVRVLGKGDKERIVPLHPRSLTWFLRYLPQRKRLIGDNPERAFFVNYRGERLSTQMMRVLVRNYARKAGIPRHVHPHMLRHSIATHLLKNGADIKSVQELLGHESLATTQVYLHLDAKDLARTIAQHHPHSKRV